MNQVLKKVSALTALASAVGTLAACGPVGLNGLQGGAALMNRPAQLNTFSRPRNGKKWTIAIHLAGDNNLYSAGLDDINEMEAALAKNPAAAEQLDVIVMFDGSPRGDSKILRIKPEAGPVNRTIISESIDDKGAVIPASKEVDSGDPAVFNAFVNFVTKNYPAQYNSISIWNHGAGIFRNGQPNPAGGSFFESVGGAMRTAGASSKSFASDDNGGEMHLKDLNSALDIANKNLGKKVDIFGFDTCLMQHVETAYQIKGQANILVASEELEPGDGWDYEAYLGALVQNPNMNPVELSSVMVDTYVKSYMPGGSQYGRDITLSAIDINALSELFVPALNAFATELKAGLPANKAAIDAARSKTETFYNRDAADFGDFMRKFAPNSRSAAALSDAMKKMVIREGHYGAGVAGATGVQTYFPTSSMGYNRRYDDPSQIRFAETKAWGDFLKAYTGK
jgi:hypothetical protein